MSKIRKAAKGQDCVLRISGICNEDITTTVHAHLNGAGMGRKSPDFMGCPACAKCHMYVDKHTKLITPLNELPDDVRAFVYHRQGIDRYQEILFEQGLIKTPGSK